MHIVRWLLSSPISLAWILAIIAILLNWGLAGKQYDSSKPKPNIQTVSTDVGGSATTENTVADTELLQAPLSPMKAADLLREARKAYWKKDYQGATALYKQLIEQDANPSHKGELANVFWKMGSTNDAANLYIEIGPWLMQQGRKSELVNMKVYVEMIDPEQAKKLGELLGQ